MTMNKLNDNQLENVVGGASYESFELFRALRGNNAFQKDYPSLFAPSVNNEINIIVMSLFLPYKKLEEFMPFNLKI